MNNIRFNSHILLFLLLLALIVLLPRIASAQAPAQATAIDGAESRIYKSIDGHDLLLHIFRPNSSAAQAASQAKPAMVFFFFFNKGREDDRWYRPALEEVDRFLTQLGYLSEPALDQQE